MENLFTTDCIRTNSGIYVNVFEPTPDMICIEDIAHSLSHQCRFAGHLQTFYSVAQHSLFCARAVDTNYKLAALLHDASEAYLVDIPTPIKRRLANYKEIEDKLMGIISEKFGFEYPLHKVVKDVDAYALQTEWDNLMVQNSFSLVPLSSIESKNQFLRFFKTLSIL